jgi:hypothetical protein
MANMKPGGAVNVEGLRELKRAFREFDQETKKELSRAGKALAVDIAAEARSEAHGLGGVAAKVAPSIKPTTLSYGLLNAGVVVGGEAYPMALGAEFGGRGRPTTQQFQPHKGRTGYFVYPTIRREAGQIEERMLDALDAAIQKAGLE